MPATTLASANRLPSLWQSRDLLWQFTQRSIELRHRGSHLGLAWSFVQPLLMLGLYVVVFGFIFDGTFGVLPDESRVDYALGIFLGLTLFHFIAETFSVAPTVIVGNPNFVKKVVFPLGILPASTVGTAAFHLLISLGLVFIGVIFFGEGLSWSALWLPLILIPIIFLALGVTYAVSALGVFWRDLQQLTQFTTLALMYASAIFFPASKVPPSIWMFLRFNPLLLAIELSRDVLLWHRPLNWHHLVYLWFASLLTFFIGRWVFERLRPAFADVL
ncbi:ABC transporter permease [Actomonas aquatica]|uniref:Transport permease protein n=1 Tax=Actomonas aquatica TaxID=2866162 RepID=A0ABZ1C9X1_9BACT|nr:ABC transporter permease [Opitutus sp. WL0086]WRQ88482.1 ABC transporter permease [Opitutus sp. WL0086]